VGFIIYLFRRDFRERPNVTRALWVPTVWMLITGSRQVSQWLNLAGIQWGGHTSEEGNPLDAIMFFGLILVGLCILHGRRVVLGEFIRHNPWLCAFLFYGFVSILWSDIPLVSCKRWIKQLGLPIMALVLLTEPDPEEALIRLMKRCAYLLLPLSVLFCKYYPGLGRLDKVYGGEDPWSGITLSKNELGCDCFILGLFFFWRLLHVWKMEKSLARRDELRLTLFFLLMDAWLMYKAKSSTSVGALALGMLVLLVLGLPNLNLRRIGTYAIATITVCAAMEWMFGISSLAIAALGRNPTLTGRVFIWREALALQPNPILGAGFESFWSGERLAIMWARHWWHPDEAHNGYIEIYLNLGIVGDVLFLGVILSTFWKGRQVLLTNFALGQLRLAFLAAIMVYNWTEAAFKGITLGFLILFFIAIEYPMVQSATGEEQPETAPETGDEELVAERGTT
jgi:O-antigen ligase